MAAESPPSSDAYAALRSEMIETVEALSAERLLTRVPQCPDWTVHDVISHVVGIVDDILAGRLEGLGSDAWTAAQVEPRRDRSTAEVCTEWTSMAAQLHERLTEQPFLGTRLIADLVTHQHDIATAIGVPAPRDSVAVRYGLERYGPYFCERVADAGLATVRIEATDTGQAWQSGEGRPAVTLRAPAFELLRAFSGRRSLTQVRAMSWSGDPDRYLSVLTPYGLPGADIVEP